MNRLLTLLAALAISTWSFGQCVANFSSGAGVAGQIHFFNSSTPLSGADAFYWDFGDGSPVSNSLDIGQADTSHVYGMNGTYVVCLTVVDSTLGCSATFCDSVYVSNAVSNCNADFTAYPDSVSTTVWFTGSTSTSTAPGALSYTWDFGDGNTGTGMNPAHTYASAGLYVACLTISDGLGCSDTYCDTVNVQQAPSGSSCSAMFTPYQDTTNASTWYFDGSASTGTGLNYSWSFGDGTSGSGIYPTHTYSAPGTYTVCLIVWDNTGNCADTTCSAITVTGSGGNPVNCTANFWSVDSANYVYFINSSTGSNLNYYWDFGDGSSSTQMHPNHMYASAGTYTVCLTVWDNAGNCADTLCSVVTVTGSTGGPACSAGYVWFVDSTFNTGSTNTVYMFNTSTGNNLTYSWDFGDGNTSNQAYPTHQYQQNGTYTVCLTVDDGAGCTHTYCDTVSYTQRQEGFTINVLPLGSNNQLSVEETGLEFNKLYPNPANESITVELNNINGNDVSLTITDMTGRTIYNNNLVGSTGNQAHNININDLSPGVYNLMIKSNNTQIVKRFIKQ